MSFFIAGALFGALFVGAAFVLYLTRLQGPKREPDPWREDTYQPPIVTTKIVNRHRSIEI